MTLKFIFKDEIKTIEYALINHYFNKYDQLRESLMRKWVKPQFVLNTIHFDLHLIDRYADDDFYYAVQGNPNLVRFGIVLMKNEMQRQSLNKSNYSAEAFIQLKHNYNDQFLTPRTWLMKDQHDQRLIIADEINVLKYLRQVITNLAQLRNEIIENNDYELDSF